MNIKRDVAAGLFFAAIGLVALLIALGYPFGSMLNMGPGYFPTVVSSLMLVLGIFLTVRSLREKSAPQLDELAWRPLIIIIVSVIGFAFLIDAGGMLPAIVFLTIVGWYADPHRSLKALPIQMTVGVVIPMLIFRIGLNMPIPLWRF